MNFLIGYAILAGLATIGICVLGWKNAMNKTAREKAQDAKAEEARSAPREMTPQEVKDHDLATAQAVQDGSSIEAIQDAVAADIAARNGLEHETSAPFTLADMDDEELIDTNAILIPADGSDPIDLGKVEITGVTIETETEGWRKPEAGEHDFSDAFTGIAATPVDRYATSPEPLEGVDVQAEVARLKAAPALDLNGPEVDDDLQAELEGYSRAARGVKLKTVSRSAITGKFVSRAFAEANPATTITQKVEALN